MAHRRAVWLATGVLVLLHLVLAVPVEHPQQLDELAYLSTAQWIATGDGLLEPEGRAAYKIGYPLLLAPAYALGGDHAVGFRWAQLLGAILMALLLPLGDRLLAVLRPEIAAADRLLIALCASLLPAAQLYGVTAMSESVMFPGILLLLLAAARALSGGGGGWWLGLGAVAGGLYLVHERGLVIVLVILVAVLLAVPRARWRALLALAGMVPLLAAERLITIPGTSYRTGSVARDILSEALADPAELVVITAGHLWYLLLATGGVVVVGLLCWRPRRWKAPASFWVALGGVSAGTFALSVLHFTYRPDVTFTHWIYGRYDEAVLVPLLLVALGSLVPPGRDETPAPGSQREGFVPVERLALGAAPSSGPPRRGPSLAAHLGERSRSPEALRRIGTAALVALGLLLIATAVLRVAWTPSSGGLFPFNAVAGGLVQWLTGWGLFRAAAVTGLATVALAALLAFRWRLGILGLGVLFVLGTAATWLQTWIPESAERVRGLDLVRFIEVNAPDAGTVHFDELAWPSYIFYAYELHLDDTELVRFSHPNLLEPRSPLVVSPRLDLDRWLPGARLAALESLPIEYPPYRLALWVLPGELQARLAAADHLFPPGFPCPLGPRQLAAEVVPARPSLRLSPGAETLLRVELTQRGDAPWPARRGVKDAPWTVLVVARWFAAGDPGAGLVTWQGRDLPHTVYPGEEVVLDLPLQARSGAEPLPHGTYLVLVGPAQLGESLELRPGPDQAEVEVVVGP